MKTLLTLLFGLLAVGPALRAQDRRAGETRDIRVYVIDRAAPDRDIKDAVASLTLDRPSGPGRTFLLHRVAGPHGSAEPAPGLLRGLPGTPYFVELNLGGAATEPAPEPPEGGNKEPTAREILRRVHQGEFFTQKIPAELVSEPFTATITIRLGSLTFTSEEFQGPRSAQDGLEEAAARVGLSLTLLTERSEQLAGFMDLRPVVVELLRDLGRLAPAGFEDGSGVFERNRQWCLAQARAIEQACYEGNTARVAELSRRYGPTLDEMRTALSRARQKEPPPEPEVPTVK